MVLNSANVRVGITGAIYVAPTGTAAPVDAATALAADWVDVGYISADGVEQVPTDETTELQAWQRAAVVRRLTTKSMWEFKFAVMETNKTGVELYYKGYTFDASGQKISVGGAAPDPRSFVLEVVDGDQSKRLYIPRGEVTSREPIKYANEEAVVYGVTVTAYEVDGRFFDEFYSVAPAVLAAAAAPAPATTKG